MHMEVPDERYWVEVGSDRRMHPYGLHKVVNFPDVEVVDSISDEDNHPKRWVLLRDGSYEVWVEVAAEEECGYPLQPAEQVSAAERHAITLKQAAMQDGERVSVDEVRTLLESGQPDQRRHALIALYYAAKADPDIPGDAVSRLRERVRKHTGHVDTSHLPTLMGILGDVVGDDESEATGR
jgi:hypothetical protein